MIPTTPFKEYQLSRLMLGSAQFGMNYGIANKSGQPSYRTVREILACAVEAGVNCLDTAASYGNSESILGKVLAELHMADRMAVVTKVIPLANHLTSRNAIDQAVSRSVLRSLKRLRLEALPICLFHHENNFRYMDSLLKLKEKGLIRHVGVSCDMTPGPAAAMLESGGVEALQIPANILDSRHIRSGIFKDAHRRGAATFVRSVYLQGLILMPERDIPPDLQAVIPVRCKLQALAEEAGISMAELAMRYMLSLEGVTSVLIGMESVDQLCENTSFFSKGSLDESLMRTISQTVPDLPEQIVSPKLWLRNVKSQEEQS